AIIGEGQPQIIRSVGRIETLQEKIRQTNPTNGSVKCGIGHTRWATHGRPSEINSHPHRDCTGRFYVAHNGIIENYLYLKHRLMAEGHVFATETDTEVLPHLIEAYYDGNLEGAVRRALEDVEGVYGIVVVSSEGYAHFMLKEIHEQPRAIRDTLRGRIGADDTVTVGRELGKADFLAGVERLQIVGMGTSLHAAQVGKFMIESLARVPVEVDNASEFRYRDPI